jgi:hypothetical protein
MVATPGQNINPSLVGFDLTSMPRLRMGEDFGGAFGQLASRML